MNEPRKAWVRLLKRARLFQLIGVMQHTMPWNENEISHYKNTPVAGIEAAITALADIAAKNNINISRTGFNDLRIHDLRRTLGSWQANNGTSLQIIGKSLGHTTQAATAIYARLADNPVRLSVNHANRTMLEMVPPAGM